MYEINTLENSCAYNSSWPAQVSIITILFIIIVIIMTNSIIIPIVTISIEIVPKYIQYLMQHNQVDTSLSIL